VHKDWNLKETPAAIYSKISSHVGANQRSSHVQRAGRFMNGPGLTQYIPIAAVMVTAATPDSI